MSNDLVNFISSVGFPIVMCVYLTFTVNKTLEDVRNTLNANTLVIKELSNKINTENWLACLLAPW